MNASTYFPKMPDGFLWKRVQSSYLIVHPKQPLWTLVNEFGFESLQLFNGENSLARCSDIIASRFGADKPTVMQDLTQFVTSLKRAGFLDTEEKDMEEKKKIDFTSAFLHVTDVCNLHCRHCYATVYRRRQQNVSDRDFIRFLEMFYSEGGTRLVLSGGEPLMHSHIRDFIGLNPRAAIRILTNGILLDNDFASFIENKQVDIQVSLDGSSARVHDSIRGTGAFQAALKGIDVLKHHGLLDRTSISTTITETNLHDLPSLIQLTHSLGIKAIRFIPVRKRGDAARNWETLYENTTSEEYKRFYRYVFDEAQKSFPDMVISSGLSGLVLRSQDLAPGNRGCSIGTNLVVDVNGDIYPCVLLMDPQYRLGNIRTTSLEKLREHEMINELVNAIYVRREKIESCSRCLWKNFCGGACLGEVHERFGTIWRTDEYCDIRRELLEKAVIRLAEGKTAVATRRKGPECF